MSSEPKRKLSFWDKLSFSQKVKSLKAKVLVSAYKSTIENQYKLLLSEVVGDHALEEALEELRIQELVATPTTSSSLHLIVIATDKGKELAKKIMLKTKTKPQSQWFLKTKTVWGKYF